MTQHTIELPPTLYEAVRRQAAILHKNPDALVIEWVASHLPPSSHSEKRHSIKAYSGCLVWPQDALAYQRGMRDEWE
ncbi:MAG: hypothetical protein OT477_15815 [Chloroflexi bacterium]|nr:hypothetical protein [Chloroflexota bacterium]